MLWLRIHKWPWSCWMIQRLQRLLQTLKEWQWSRMLRGFNFLLTAVIFFASPDMTVCINKGDDGSCQYQVAQRQSKSIESRRKVGLLIALERRVTNHGMWRIMSQPVSEEIWHTKEAIFNKAGGAKWSSQQLESTWWKCQKHALNRLTGSRVPRCMWQGNTEINYMDLYESCGLKKKYINTWHACITAQRQNALLHQTWKINFQKHPHSAVLHILDWNLQGKFIDPQDASRWMYHWWYVFTSLESASCSDTSSGNKRFIPNNPSTDNSQLFGTALPCSMVPLRSVILRPCCFASSTRTAQQIWYRTLRNEGYLLSLPRRMVFCG